MTARSGYHGREHWDAVHRWTGTSRESNASAAVMRSAVRALAGRLAGGSVVLDVACGDGLLLRTLPERATRLGTDLSRAAVSGARTLTGGANCGWLQAHAAQLPVRSASVDVVTYLSTWWIVPDIDRCLAEVVRVLRPGGILLVHVWGPAHTCRLITLGASAIAKVLPGMLRPPGVPGPFEVIGEDVTARVCAAGLLPPCWSSHSYSWPISTVREYWHELAHLAPTSYAAYRSASQSDRAAVDGLLIRLLDQTERTGAATLGLTWRLALSTVRHLNEGHPSTISGRDV